MDEDTAIINSNTRNEKIKNFCIKNKKLLILILAAIVFSLMGYFAFSEYKDKNKTNKTRFILNLKLDELGELQIDGRVNSKTVELLIQTIKPISAELKQGILEVFQNTLSRTEIDGNIVFRVRKQLDPLPITELNGYSDPILSITDI